MSRASTYAAAFSIMEARRPARFSTKPSDAGSISAGVNDDGSANVKIERYPHVGDWLQFCRWFIDTFGEENP